MGKPNIQFFFSISVSTQTNLSFPSVLPDHIEEILKPYFMNSVKYYTIILMCMYMNLMLIKKISNSFRLKKMKEK